MIIAVMVTCLRLLAFNYSTELTPMIINWYSGTSQMAVLARNLTKGDMWPSVTAGEGQRIISRANKVLNNLFQVSMKIVVFLHCLWRFEPTVSRVLTASLLDKTSTCFLNAATSLLNVSIAPIISKYFCCIPWFHRSWSLSDSALDLKRVSVGILVLSPRDTYCTRSSNL